MKALFYLIGFLFMIGFLFVKCVHPSDNDFSEFDDLDEPEIKIGVPELVDKDFKIDQTLKDNQYKANEDLKNIAIEDEEEVTIEEDNELEDDLPAIDKLQEKKPFEPIKLSSLPLHLRNNWTSYYIELTLVCGIIIYFINLFVGSSKNQKLAEKFLTENYDLLKSHFTIVGDDGSKELDKEAYVKDSDNTFILWSTGRFGYECCIIELHFKKRQDLLSGLCGLIKPSNDQMIVKIFLKDDSMDSFVFCLANKKTGFKTIKEYNDVVTFCTQRKSIEKYSFLNDNFILLNEIGDVTTLVLDNQLINLLASSPELVNFIHISDQFSGPKPSDQDAQPTKAPHIKKVLTLSFNFPKNFSSSIDVNLMKDFLLMSLNLAERVKRFKLKKDMKQKAIGNRRKVEEYYEKLLNAEKQQAAQLKREEKRRLEKEKIIDANDEFKLRKFEDREYKKEMKKKLKPKMKQIRAN